MVAQRPVRECDDHQQAARAEVGDQHRAQARQLEPDSRATQRRAAAVQRVNRQLRAGVKSI